MQMAEIYNLRLVYDWHKHYQPEVIRNIERSFTDATYERRHLLDAIAKLPVHPEVMCRLMWEP